MIRYRGNAVGRMIVLVVDRVQVLLFFTLLLMLLQQQPNRYRIHCYQCCYENRRPTRTTTTSMPPPMTMWKLPQRQQHQSRPSLSFVSRNGSRAFESSSSLFLTKGTNNGHDHDHDSDNDNDNDAQEMNSIEQMNDDMNNVYSTNENSNDTNYPSKDDDFVAGTYYNDFDDDMTSLLSTETTPPPLYYDDFQNGPLIGSSSNTNSPTNDNILSSTTSYYTSLAASTQSTLQTRITTIQQQEQRQNIVQSRNWKYGNWFVRGFSLDDVTDLNTNNNDNNNQNASTTYISRNRNVTTTTTGAGVTPSISVIVKSSSLSLDDEEDDYDLDSDNYDDDYDYDHYDNQGKNRIDCWVGRTDGSIYGIQFGTDYYTKLQSNGSRDSSSSDIDTTSISPSFGEDDTSIKYDDDSIDDDDDDDEANDVQQLPSTVAEKEKNPFRIVTQWKSSSQSITSIAAISVPTSVTTNAIASSTSSMLDKEEDTEMSFDIYTASSTEIHHWYYDRLLSPQLKNVLTIPMNTPILQLKIIRQRKRIQRKKRSITKTDSSVLLLSTTATSIVIWDIPTDRIVGYVSTIRFPLPSIEQEQSMIITCMDTDDTFIYVGTKSGYVLVYTIEDILVNYHNNNNSNVDVVGFWRASPSDDCSITAIQCGGPGTLGRRASMTNTANTKSTILYTGDEMGTVKLWEVIQIKRPTIVNNDSSETITDEQKQQSLLCTYKVDAWPKLSTQRLQKRAHVFKGHDRTITSLLSVDPMKFVSASDDGTVRAWNTATGKEMFCMDGFPNAIRSLCLFDSEGNINDKNKLRNETSERIRNSILVTDGMDKYVCVHDFSADDEEEADYDLEMPEYIN